MCSLTLAHCGPPPVFFSSGVQFSYRWSAGSKKTYLAKVDGSAKKSSPLQTQSAVWGPPFWILQAGNCPYLWPNITSPLPVIRSYPFKMLTLRSKNLGVKSPPFSYNNQNTFENRLFNLRLHSSHNFS